MAAKVDLLTLTAVDLQALLRKNALTSVEIVKLYLDHIERHNHAGIRLNAVISTAPRDSVFKIAEKLDEERRQNLLRGPLHGIPILVKDQYNTPGLGMATTCGSLALTGARAKSNALVIDKLIEAGMIVIGKTNLSEFGNMKGFGLMSGWSALGGQTQTPYVIGGLPENTTHVLSHWGPAGSSSGSAASVAAGFAPLSLGTESDGSIVMPACRHGVFAIKITRGTVDDTGVQPALRAFDCLGGFSRNAIDLAHLVATMQGKAQEAYLPLEPSWHGLKLGFSDPSKWRSYASVIEPMEGFFEQTDAANFAAQDTIRSLGGKVVSFIPLISYDDVVAAMPSMENMEDMNPYQARQCFPDWLASFEDGPKTVEELIDFNVAHADEEFNQINDNQKFLEAIRDDKTSKEEFERNLEALRTRASSSILKLMEEYDVDVIVGPGDSRTGSMSSAAGFPSANLPLGFADFNGRGFGLHMIARPNEEKKLLEIMAAWEATFPDTIRPPPQLSSMSVILARESIQWKEVMQVLYVALICLVLFYVHSRRQRSLKAAATYNKVL